MEKYIGEQLTKYEIICQYNAYNSVKFAFGSEKRDIVLEPRLELRAGIYDILKIGAYSYIGGGSTIARHIKSIGRYCAIASNFTSGQVEHPIDFLSTHHLFHAKLGKNLWPSTKNFFDKNEKNLSKSMNTHLERIEAKKGHSITIGNDVWIGEGVFVSRNVNIGNGAIVAARAVVTKDVPPYAIVGGVPAKVIKYRFPKDVIAELLDLKWWDYDLETFDNVDFTDIKQAIKQIKLNITNGNYKKLNEHLLVNFSSNNISLIKASKQ